MGWLEGLLTGYADRHYEIAKQKREEAALAATREGEALSTLLNSPYPQIKQMAAAGILDLGNPRKRAGGFAGWMGEMQQSPHLPAIQRAMGEIAAAQTGSDAEYDAVARTLGPGYARRAGAPPATPPPTQTGAPTTGGGPPPLPSIPAISGSMQAPPSAGGPAVQPSTTLVTGGPTDFAAPAPTTQPAAPAAPPAPPAAGAPQAAAAPPQPPQPAGPIAPRGPVDANGPFTPAGIPGQMAPPTPPAGPPLPIAGAPPPPPGQVGAGLPNATVASVGQQPPVRSQRTQLPGIFPTAADQYREQSRAQIMGKVEAYAQMYQLKGLPEDQAYDMAAALVEQDVIGTRGSSSLTNLAMEFDITDASGNTQRVLGWQDRQTRQFLDASGRPFPAGVTISKAAPYSAITGDVWERMAQRRLGIHPGEVASDPAKAALVQDLADELAGGRAARLTTDRGNAAATIPLSSNQRIDTMTQLQNRYNAYNQPLRLMELYLRNMSAAYTDLKDGKMVAWEPFRTAFVHVNEAGSVVMPSEFSRAGGIGSLYERIVGQVDQWMQGGGPLPANLIDDMMHIAESQWNAVSTYDQNFRTQVDQALQDPALVGIRGEQIYGPPRERFDPRTIYAPPPTTPPPAGPPAAPGTTETVFENGRFITRPKRTP